MWFVNNYITSSLYHWYMIVIWYQSHNKDDIYTHHKTLYSFYMCMMICWVSGWLDGQIVKGYFWFPLPFPLLSPISVTARHDEASGAWDWGCSRVDIILRSFDRGGVTRTRTWSYLGTSLELDQQNAPCFLPKSLGLNRQESLTLVSIFWEREKQLRSICCFDKNPT